MEKSEFYRLRKKKYDVKKADKGRRKAQGGVTLTFGACMFGTIVKCLTEYGKENLDKPNVSY